MTADIVTPDDLRPVIPSEVDAAALAAMASDLNALLVVRVPCLASATPEVLRAAKATIRQHCRGIFANGGAKSVTRAHGPFRHTYNYEVGGGSLVDESLVDALRSLCDPRHGAKMALIDMDHVQRIPPSGYPCPDEVSLPDLRWW